MKLIMSIAVCVTLVGMVHAGFLDAIKNVASEAASAVGDAASNAIVVKTNKTNNATSFSQGNVKRRHAESPSADAEEEKKQKALRCYDDTDNTEMPECVYEVASYIRGELTDALNRARECEKNNHAFFSKMGSDEYGCYRSPWEQLYNPPSGGARNDCIDAFHWVETCYNKSNENECPIRVSPGRGNVKWFKVGAGSLAVQASGSALKDGCLQILVLLKELVYHLNCITKRYSWGKGVYADRHAELHGGLSVPLKAYKEISFGDSPFDVYNKLKDEMTKEAVLLERSSIPKFAWPESYQIKLPSHTLELGFARFSEDDVAGLVYLSMSFNSSLPSTDALKTKYGKLGFEFTSTNKHLGKRWKNRREVSEFTLEQYGEAQLGIRRAQGAERERYKKIITDVESKYMEDVYQECVTGTNKGYFIQFNPKSPHFELATMSLSNEDVDVNQVESVVIMDEATSEVQILAYNQELKRQEEEKAKAEAARKKKESEAALDF